VVKLRVRGSVKYAHFDFTRNPGAQEIDEAVQALQRGDFGWQTSKMVGARCSRPLAMPKAPSAATIRAPMSWSASRA
jgi:hypothetical protein